MTIKKLDAITILLSFLGEFDYACLRERLSVRLVDNKDGHFGHGKEETVGYDAIRKSVSERYSSSQTRIGRNS